jgi:hypothetical protein
MSELGRFRREEQPVNSVPPLDDAAHLDGLLMHELTVVNAQLGRYVLRYLDADAGRAEHVSPAEERALAEQVRAAADGIRARAARRELHGASPSDGHVDEER